MIEQERLDLVDNVGCEHTFYLLRMVGDAKGKDIDFYSRGIRASIKILLADGIQRTSHNTIQKAIPLIVR